MIAELKTFVAVAGMGTFAAAGQQIGLAQAAVRAQTKRLKDEPGFTLFDRTGRSARINRRGQQTLTQAQEWIELHGQLGARQRTRARAVFLSLGAIASVQQSMPALASEPFRLLVPRSAEGDDWRKLLTEQAFFRYDRSSLGGRPVDRFLTEQVEACGS